MTYLLGIKIFPQESENKVDPAAWDTLVPERAKIDALIKVRSGPHSRKNTPETENTL